MVIAGLLKLVAISEKPPRLGARNFIVTNYFPEFRPAMNSFNGLWWAELDHLESELPINVFRFDFEGWIWDVIADPASFGFTNITEPALDPITGVVVPNPEEYLIWDSPFVHLTTRGHEIVADRVYSVIVPEPLTNLYAILSVFLFAKARFRRSVTRGR